MNDDEQQLLDMFGPPEDSIVEPEEQVETEDDIFSDYLQKEKELNNDTSAGDADTSTAPLTQTNIDSSTNSDTDWKLDESFIRDILKVNNIDADNIQFQDSAGNLYTRKWNELSREDLINNIIGSLNKDPQTDLDNDEIDLINQMRRANLSPKDFVNQLRQEAVDSYLNANPDSRVADLTDEELYAYYHMAKYQNKLSDEQIQDMVNKEKENPDIFKIKVDAFREELLAQEQEKLYKQQEEEVAKYQEEYREYESNVLSAIDNFNNIPDLGVELDNSDKETLARYMLDVDSNGQSAFTKDLSNPNNRVITAFWAVYGPTIAQEAQNQYNEAYKRGYAKAREEFAPSKFVQTRQPKNSTTTNRVITIGG